MFENPRRGRQARNFTTNVPKILDLKSSSEQIFSRKLSLGAPEMSHFLYRLFFFLVKITFLASKDSVLEFTSYLLQFFFLLLIMVNETLDT